MTFRPGRSEQYLMESYMLGGCVCSSVGEGRHTPGSAASLLMKSFLSLRQFVPIDLYLKVSAFLAPWRWNKVIFKVPSVCCDSGHEGSTFTALLPLRAAGTARNRWSRAAPAPQVRGKGAPRWAGSERLPAQGHGRDWTGERESQPWSAERRGRGRAGLGAAAAVPEMAAEREQEPGPGAGAGAAAGERSAAGGCRCSALPAPRQGLTEEARCRLREFDVGDKFCRLPLPRAAVLLPLMVRRGRLHLLLTVRSMQVPGGSERRDPCRESSGVRPPIPPLVPKGTASCCHAPGFCWLPAGSTPGPRKPGTGDDNCQSRQRPTDYLQKESDKAVQLYSVRFLALHLILLFLPFDT